jgi:glycosyltransferase involved in cell wall biosynthesis
MTARGSSVDVGAGPAQCDGPRLSVTVLNYNYGRFLGDCLRSILSQTYTNFEVIVIDDCSNDDSIRVIEPFLEDSRIRLIAHAENVGFVRSLVEGSEASSSPYLTVISADDFILSVTAFEQQIGLLESNRTTSFCYASWIAKETASAHEGEALPWRMIPFSEDHVWSGDEEFKHLCTSHYILHSGTIVRRTAYDAIGGYDTSIRYTIDITMWALLCGVGDVAFVAEPLYGYRVHGSNMSRSPKALRATTGELIRMVDLAFANLPEGPVKSDRRLLRRARQYALIIVPRQQIFAGHQVDGWKTLAYGARLRPSEALLQSQVAYLAARTLCGPRGFEWLQGLRRGWTGPIPRSRRKPGLTDAVGAPPLQQ